MRSLLFQTPPLTRSRMPPNSATAPRTDRKRMDIAALFVLFDFRALFVAGRAPLPLMPHA
jgi:hypothetical protein